MLLHGAIAFSSRHSHITNPKPHWQKHNLCSNIHYYQFIQAETNHSHLITFTDKHYYILGQQLGIPVFSGVP